MTNEEAGGVMWVVVFAAVLSAGLTAILMLNFRSIDPDWVAKRSAECKHGARAVYLDGDVDCHKKEEP